MELTNPQLYALFGAAIAVLILIGITYCAGLKTGHSSGWQEGRQAGTNYWRPLFQEKRDERLEALDLLDKRERELATLRRNIQAEADDHAEVERGLLQRLAAAAPFNDEDQATLQAIAAKLELAADTFAGIGVGDHARFARQLAQHALNMAQRLHAAAANTLPHPDSELIDWLEEEATVDFDLETASLRFLCPPGSELGVSSTRALLRQAKADSEQIERNHADSLAEASRMCAEKSWLVHGPQACGKTRNAHAIAEAFGLCDIRDDWEPGMPVAITGGLYLTNSEGPFDPFTRRILPFDLAMRVVAGELHPHQALDIAHAQPTAA